MAGLLFSNVTKLVLLCYKYIGLLKRIKKGPAYHSWEIVKSPNRTLAILILRHVYQKLFLLSHSFEQLRLTLNHCEQRTTWAEKIVGSRN